MADLVKRKDIFFKVKTKTRQKLYKELEKRDLSSELGEVV